MPYLQDYFAVRQLKETGVIDAETVVLPGHPGDFLRGSHLYSRLPLQDSQQVILQIPAMFGTSLPLKKNEKTTLNGKVESVFNISKGPFSASEGFERWDFEERQAKFIANSSQVYDFFGISCLMPLFDRELIGFFLSLQFDQRLGAVLYYQTLEEQFFKPLGFDFDLRTKGIIPKETPEWKILLLKITPHVIRECYYPVRDDAFYAEITRELMISDPDNRYRRPLKSHYFNGYLTQWYYNHLQALIRLS
jgi:asparagine synthase (glutamine-hydrolysing)